MCMLISVSWACWLVWFVLSICSMLLLFILKLWCERCSEWVEICVVCCCVVSVLLLVVSVESRFDIWLNVLSIICW